MPFVLMEKPRTDIALVTLNRPERMNAMAFDVMIPLREALEEVSSDNAVRVVVLTGAGHGFVPVPTSRILAPYRTRPA